jgi:hypothetical protein
MKRPAVAAVALACLALPAAALAHLPRAHSTRIVPGKSIGGVKLDMTKAQALGKWGAPTKCQLSTCDWQGPGPAGQNERAILSFVQGKIVQITIYASFRGNNQRYHPGTLSNWSTSKGIHLGSPKKKVPKAYPAAKSNPSTGVQGYDLFIGARPNLTNTRFSTPGVGASANLLWTISVSWDSCHYFPCQ